MKKSIKRPYLASAAIIGAVITPIIAYAAIFHSGTGSVDGFLCVGIECNDYTAAIGRTLVLKEDSVEMVFEDDSDPTSTFPTNDWEILINDSFSNGEEYFAIRDIDGNRIPFRIQAGAPNDSLIVADSGEIGIGTNVPLKNIHIDDGFEATIRMEGSTQAFDMGVNSGRFFIQDQDTANVVMHIEDNVRGEALYLDDTNRIGMGTRNPEESLHLVGESGESTSFMLENVGVGGAGDGRWEFVMRKADGEFAINDADTPGGDFIFTGPSDEVNGSTAFTIFNPTRGARWDLETRGSDGDFAIDDRRTAGASDFIFRSSITNDPDGAGLYINGKIVTTGSCSAGCDAVFNADYDLPSIEDHAEEMFAKKHLPTVGPTESGQIDLTQKMLTMLNELEKAHIYIAELNEEKKALADRLESQRQDFASRLEALEAGTAVSGE